MQMLLNATLQKQTSSIWKHLKFILSSDKVSLYFSKTMQLKKSD